MNAIRYGGLEGEGVGQPGLDALLKFPVLFVHRPFQSIGHPL